MTYIIQKKTKCDKCDGGGTRTFTGSYVGAITVTCDCSGGYLYEEVDFGIALQEVLTTGAKTSKRNVFYIDTPNTGV